MRRISHGLGIITGIIAGLVFFVYGIRGVFSIGVHDTWLTMAEGSILCFPLLPLTMFGIFKPRGAARALLGSGLFNALFAVVYLMNHKAPEGVSVFRVLWGGVLMIGPPVVVAVLFLYASRSTVLNQNNPALYQHRSGID